jgi:hypothetical protein
VHARTSSESKLSTIQDFLDELENRKKIIIHERKEIAEGGWTISLVQPLLFWSSGLLFFRLFWIVRKNGVTSEKMR